MEEIFTLNLLKTLEGVKPTPTIRLPIYIHFK